MMLGGIDLDRFRDVRRARKRPLRRPVRFAREAGVCTTLEGNVRYRAGDAIVTGEQGEQWPVERAQFMASYQVVPPVVPGEDGFYLALSNAVRVLRLTEPTTLVRDAGDDRLSGQAGDWLVQYEDGSQAIVRSDIFAESYELLPESDREAG